MIVLFLSFCQSKSFNDLLVVLFYQLCQTLNEMCSSKNFDKLTSNGEYIFLML